MRITEGQLRRIIREMLLEDLAGFVERTKDISYESSFEDPTFEEAPHIRTKAKDVKRAWAAEADHEFMKSIIKIHWIDERDDKSSLKGRFDAFMALRGSDEISTMGYIQDSHEISSEWGSLGIIVQGRVTLAANRMDDIVSGYFGNTSKEIASKYAPSGTPRRATRFDPLNASNYILDRDSFDPDWVQSNEFVVGNWKPVGIIVSRRASEFIEDVWMAVKFHKKYPEPRYANLILKYNLPIYDKYMEPIDRNKIEAALRGEEGG
jgi:hypothetical protein